MSIRYPEPDNCRLISLFISFEYSWDSKVYTFFRSWVYFALVYNHFHTLYDTLRNKLFNECWYSTCQADVRKPHRFALSTLIWCDGKSIQCGVPLELIWQVIFTFIQCSMCTPQSKVGSTYVNKTSSGYENFIILMRLTALRLNQAPKHDNQITMSPEIHYSLKQNCLSFHATTHDALFFLWWNIFMYMYHYFIIF